MNINLKTNKDEGIQFIEEAQSENKNSASRYVPLWLWLMPINLAFLLVSGFLSFKFAILLSSDTVFRIAGFVAFFVFQLSLFKVFLKTADKCIYGRVRKA